MLRFKKNILRKPPEGWHYIEDKQTIDGETVEDVEKQIAAYRIRNGRPPGDPHQDMINFWVVKRPDFLEMTPEGAPPEPKTPPDELGSVLLWLQRITQQGSDLEVGRGVIEERVTTCLECPCNVSISGSQSIKDEIDRRSFMIRKGEVTPGLHVCSCHLMDLRVAVRLRSEFLTQDPQQPGNCWVKK